MRSRTLLGLWAHPDDEAYLSAGLMYHFVRRGDRVVVVTATAGERGTADPRTWPPSRLGVRRRQELAASLAALGVDEHDVLGFEDGRCADVDGTEVLAAHIGEIGPDVIVTFGPDGITGHPDHRAVSAWATAAWERAGRCSELWYATLAPDFHHRWGALNDRIGLFVDQPHPPSTAAGELAHRLDLDGEALDAKVAALVAHRTQTAGLIETVGPETYRQWWRTEAFRTAAPRPVRAPALRGAHP